MALREIDTNFGMHLNFQVKIVPQNCIIWGMKRIEMTGLAFGKLTVLGYAATSRAGTATWRCRCECGMETVVSRANLQSGNTRSCGCSWRRRGLSHPNAVHAEAGKRPTTEYRAWSNMMTRCYNAKNKSYADYGGRGITVCERWRDSFEAFLGDVGRRPPGAQLDRRDNNGNYEPENVRWVSIFTQARNRRSTRLSVAVAADITAALRSGASQRVLATKYGVMRGAIQGIWRRIRSGNGPP